MADGYGLSSLSVRLPARDRRWLAEFARETDVSVAALVVHAVRHLRGWEETGRRAAEDVLA